MFCRFPIGAVIFIGLIFCYFLRKLRLAYVVCFGFLNAEYRIALVGFICSSRGRIRKLRLAYIVCLVFLNEEYRIALVDFIAPCGGTKGRRRRTLRSPSPPWNHACVVHWTPPPHPGVSAAAGHDCCRGLMPILDSGIRCCRYSPVPNFVQLSVFGLVSFAFQSG